MMIVRFGKSARQVVDRLRVRVADARAHAPGAGALAGGADIDLHRGF